MTIEINLIPLKTRQQKWGRPAAILGTILFVLLLSGLFLLRFEKIQALKQEGATLKTLQVELAKINQSDPANSKQVLTLQSEVKQLSQGATHSEALLMTFVKLLPKNSILTTFDYQNGVLTLTGNFQGLDEVAGFYHAVRTNTLVTQATLNKVDSSSTSDYTADFTIQINQSAYKAMGGDK